MNRLMPILAQFGYCVLCGFSLGVAQSPPNSDAVELQQATIRYPERIELAFATPGRVKAIHVEEGQQVTAGELIAELENAREKAELALRELKANAQETLVASHARIRSAETALENAVGANRLIKATVPFQELRRLTLDSELARAELGEKELETRLAGFEATIAKAAFEATQIHAPVSGVVTRKFVSAGSSIEGPRPVVQIVDRSKLRIEGYVTLSNMRRLRPGQEIQVRCSSGETMTARLVFIDIAAQQVQKLVRVWGTLRAADEIIEGETVTARILLAE